MCGVRHCGFGGREGGVNVAREVVGGWCGKRDSGFGGVEGVRELGATQCCGISLFSTRARLRGDGTQVKMLYCRWNVESLGLDMRAR